MPTPRPSHAQATPTPRPSHAHATPKPRPRPSRAHATPTPRPSHAQATPTPRPRHAQATHAQATPTPRPRHAQATPNWAGARKPVHTSFFFKSKPHSKLFGEQNKTEKTKTENTETIKKQKQKNSIKDIEKRNNRTWTKQERISWKEQIKTFAEAKQQLIECEIYDCQSKGGKKVAILI